MRALRDERKGGGEEEREPGRPKDGADRGADAYLYQDMSDANRCMEVAGIYQYLWRSFVVSSGLEDARRYGKMYEAFYELFANKYVRIVDAESKSKKYRALQRVTNYIDEHYIDGLSLDEVAAATGISRYYVSHLFKELMDTTFVGYVNELRLNRAAMLLMTSDSPIIEIAALSGFNNLSNFNRAFKLHFGKTPSAYRKS